MSSVVIAGNTSGTVTLDAPDIAGSTVLTLPATSGTVLTSASTTGISGSAISTGTVAVGVGGTGLTSPGTSGNALVSNGTSWTSGKQTITSGTAVSASGTSVDFTSIPSWVKRITVMFDGTSSNGTSSWLIRLGDAGGIETTGYASGAAEAASDAFLTTGFLVLFSVTASSTYAGSIQITNVSGNTWVSSGNITNASTAVWVSAGNKTLSDVLTQIRITTVNGTDTFDAGSINILYE